MIYLIFLPLRNVFTVFLTAYALASVVGYFADVNGLFWAFPVFSGLVSAGILKRSRWYLSLPYSRMKVALIAIMQNFAAFGVSLLLSGLCLYMKGVNIFETLIYPFWFWGFAYLYCWFTFSAFGNIVSPGDRESTRHLLQIRRIFLFWLILLVCFVLWKTGYYSEPLLYVALGIGILCFCIIILLNNFVVPFKTFIKAVNIVICTGTAFFVSCVLALQLIVSSSYLYKHSWSLKVLGRLPSSLNADRALDLFRSTSVGISPALMRFQDHLTTNISQEDWFNRTALCKDWDCVNMSAAIVPANLESNDVAKAFFVLMGRCDFIINRNGGVSCEKGAIEYEFYKNWTELVRKGDTLSIWLKSDEPKKQILAFKMLPLANGKHLNAEITKLVSSSNAIVRNTAGMYLQIMDSEKDLDSFCKIDEDAKDKDCEAWRRLRAI